VVICSSAFEALGRSQARALGAPDLHIAVMPHPFGSRTRVEVREIAERCVDAIVKQTGLAAADPLPLPRPHEDRRTCAPEAQEAFDAWCRERCLSDGLPLIAPTSERVLRMLDHVERSGNEIVARIPPAFGEATVERIAANAVMAGCSATFLPVVLAAVEAVCEPAFNLQGVQTTTNPAAPWIIVNGPIAGRLGVNAGINCLGQGSWANATIGRALRLVLQNIGGGAPGVMDRASQGQPGKYSFCCAENEAASPWAPLHVEHGYEAAMSTVTVVAAAGTLNLNSHTKSADELLAAIADTLAYPMSNDYWYDGEPWIILAPEHAQVLHRAGLRKADVRERLWNEAKLHASRLSASDFTRPAHARAAELGAIDCESAIPITRTPAGIGLLVAGGPGTHSVYVPGYGNSRSVTRAIDA
jgi:hypothetical protein